MLLVDVFFFFLGGGEGVIFVFLFFIFLGGEGTSEGGRGLRQKIESLSLCQTKILKNIWFFLPKSLA